MADRDTPQSNQDETGDAWDGRLVNFDGDPVPESRPVLESRPDVNDTTDQDNDPLGQHATILGVHWGWRGFVPKDDLTRGLYWLTAVVPIVLFTAVGLILTAPVFAPATPLVFKIAGITAGLACLLGAVVMAGFVIKGLRLTVRTLTRRR